MPDADDIRATQAQTPQCVPLELAERAPIVFVREKPGARSLDTRHDQIAQTAGVRVPQPVRVAQDRTPREAAKTQLADATCAGPKRGLMILSTPAGRSLTVGAGPTVAPKIVLAGGGDCQERERSLQAFHGRAHDHHGALLDFQDGARCRS